MDLQSPDSAHYEPTAKSSGWKITKETLSGEPFKPGSSAYLAASLDGEIKESNSVLLTIKAAFLPFPVKKGIIVVTECQVGTTGARFTLEAQEASLKNLTSDVQIDTSYEVSKSSGATVKLEPKVKTKISKAEVEISPGSAESEKSVTKKVVFSSGETLLVGTTIGSDMVRWSLRPHSGEKAVVDYLEGNLEILALGSWADDKLPTFISTVEPRDRVFWSRR